MTTSNTASLAGIIKQLCIRDDFTTLKYVAFTSLALLKNNAQVEELSTDVRVINAIVSSVKTDSISYSHIIDSLLKTGGKGSAPSGFRILQDSLSKYLNFTGRLGTVIESVHPYLNSACDTYEIDLPGGVGMQLYFSLDTSMETNCDSIRFYSADPRANNGADKSTHEIPSSTFTGRKDDLTCFPHESNPLYGVMLDFISHS